MINCVVQLIMSYRHPNEIKANKELLEESMKSAVTDGLNEVMPGVMEEMESVLVEKIDELKKELVEKEDPVPKKTLSNVPGVRVANFAANSAAGGVVWAPKLR